jgi:hypothetical protein
MAITVKVPVWSDSELKGVEAVEAGSVAPNRYRLEITPGLVEGLAAGDVIELSDKSPGFTIIERGNNFGVSGSGRRGVWRHRTRR